MLDCYPLGPASVPSDLARPSSAYKKRVYIAALGLMLFLLFYVGLVAWFGHTAYRMFVGDGVHPVVGIFAGFLGLFMLQALFFVRRGKHEGFEVTREAYPKLFAFLERLADQASAPRPHRVFLAPGVNAGVFYDVSLANLVFLSRKNLEIGLGLINVLTLPICSRCSR